MRVINGLRNCLSLIGKHKRAYFSTVLLGGLLTYSADMFFAMLNKGVVNSVTSMDYSEFKSAVVFGLIALAAYLLDVPVSQYFKMRSIRHIMYDMRVNLFRHMEFLSVGYFEKNHSADSIFRLNSNVENMKRAYTNYFPNVAYAVLGGVASCVFIMVLDLRLGLISLATCTVTFLVNLKFSEPLRRIGGEIQRRESELLSRLSDLLAGFRIIKLYDSDSSALGRYEERNDSVAGLRVKRMSKIGIIDGISQLLNFVNNFVLITIGAVMAAMGYCDFGTVFAILSVQSNVSSMLLTFGTTWGMMQECIAASELIHEIFDQSKEVRKATMSHDEDVSDDFISFENVSFSYDDDSGSVLDKLSLTVEKGEVAALVGPSGGGKSTVIKLLSGFYKIAEGKIYFCGRNMDSYNIDEVRDLIAYVPQDAYLFDTTVKENISYGKPGASDEEIIAAAKAANAHEFISEMSSGYDTLVGERGESLSGGQRQRIAIARAFLKNAPILLLDEATSALDTENEQIVQKSIEALMKNRTVIVVAHRLTTIENADVIYVIEHGRVEQKGTHEQLKAIPGIYSSLVKLNAGM